MYTQRLCRLNENHHSATLPFYLRFSKDSQNDTTKTSPDCGNFGPKACIKKESKNNSILYLIVWLDVVSVLSVTAEKCTFSLLTVGLHNIILSDRPNWSADLT